jgi:hypothetical protein
MTYDNFVLLRQQLVSSFKKESIVMLERFVNTHGNNGEFFSRVFFGIPPIERKDLGYRKAL